MNQCFKKYTDLKNYKYKCIAYTHMHTRNSLALFTERTWEQEHSKYDKPIQILATNTILH